MTTPTLTDPAPDMIPDALKNILKDALISTKYPLASTYWYAQLTCAGSEITVSLFFQGDASGLNPCSMDELIRVVAGAGTFVALVISGAVDWDLTIQGEPTLRHAINDYACSRVQIDCRLRLVSYKGVRS